MAPCIPPTAENADKLAKKGVDMIILGNDVMFLNQGCQRAAEAMKAVNG
jgi:4-hydroxy-2-oxoheptanedioate aldolase